MSGEPAGLYLHVPFCSQICPYCDFAVRTGDAARRRRFADHLVAEIALWTGDPRTFDTVYFGGGTPSLLEPRDLARILDAVREHLHLLPDTRIFLEANPEDLDAGKLDALRQIGVATLSLGVQAFDAALLEFLGRRHGPDRSRQAISDALAAGFDTVSVDLIYGLPGQTPEAWCRELDQALEAGPHHLSCYQLTVHDRTRFGLLRDRGRLIEMSEDDQADRFRLTHEHLGRNGMHGYEVSQFSREPRHRSRHNRKYWDHTAYLGLGPSAHSFDGERRRWWNLRRTDAWQDAVADGRKPLDEVETLDPPALVLEALMTGLRTYAGVDLERVERRWGIDLLPANRERLAEFASRGLIDVRGSRIVPTLSGLAVADALARQIEIPHLAG